MCVFQPLSRLQHPLLFKSLPFFLVAGNTFEAQPVGMDVEQDHIQAESVGRFARKIESCSSKENRLVLCRNWPSLQCQHRRIHNSTLST